MKKKTMMFLVILLAAVSAWLWHSKSRVGKHQLNTIDSGDHQIIEVSESKSSKIRQLEDGLSGNSHITESGRSIQKQTTLCYFTMMPM